MSNDKRGKKKKEFFDYTLEEILLNPKLSSKLENHPKKDEILLKLYEAENAGLKGYDCSKIKFKKIEQGNPYFFEAAELLDQSICTVVPNSSYLEAEELVGGFVKKELVSAYAPHLASSNIYESELPYLAGIAVNKEYQGKGIGVCTLDNFVKEYVSNLWFAWISHDNSEISRWFESLYETAEKRNLQDYVEIIFTNQELEKK